MKNLLKYIPASFLSLFAFFKPAKVTQLIPEVKTEWDTVYEAEIAQQPSNPSQAVIYKQLVNNQLAYFKTHINGNSTNQLIPLVLWFKLSCAVIRKIQILSEIVGVQPIDGPLNYVYTLNYMLNDDNKARLEITKSPVEALSRKLALSITSSSLWMLEAQGEVEWIDCHANEIAHDIIFEVLTNLKQLSIKSDSQGVNLLNREQLVGTINQACNEIATDTQRGSGNFIIVSPMVLSMLVDTNSKFAKTDNYNSNFTLDYCGMLNDTIKVYCSLYAEDDIIVGYKGDRAATDTGFVYCPYIPVMTAGIIIDPTTFDQLHSVATRYGMFSSEHALGGFKGVVTSDKYYRTIKTTLDLSDVGFLFETKDTIQ